jgi:iron only hydrogenase large subunit-like protein
VRIAKDFGAHLEILDSIWLVVTLRHLVFDKGYNTNFAADPAITEEGSKLINWVKNGGVLPIFTPCYPV